MAQWEVDGMTADGTRSSVTVHVDPAGQTSLQAATTDPVLLSAPAVDRLRAALGNARSSARGSNGSET